MLSAHGRNAHQQNFYIKPQKLVKPNQNKEQDFGSLSYLNPFTKIAKTLIQCEINIYPGCLHIDPGHLSADRYKSSSL